MLATPINCIDLERPNIDRWRAGTGDCADQFQRGHIGGKGSGRGIYCAARTHAPSLYPGLNGLDGAGRKSTRFSKGIQAVLVR